MPNISSMRGVSPHSNAATVPTANNLSEPFNVTTWLSYPVSLQDNQGNIAENQGSEDQEQIQEQEELVESQDEELQSTRKTCVIITNADSDFNIYKFSDFNFSMALDWIPTLMNSKGAPKEEIHLVNELLDIILSSNYVSFNNMYYLQEIGVPTGSPCGASVANLTPTSVCTESCLPGFWKAVQRGEPVCCFKCVPCSKGEISNITDATECIKCPEDHWTNNHLLCIAKDVEFLSFEEPLGVTLSTISTSFSFITVLIFCIFIKNRDTPIVKANNRELSFLLLLALMLCFLCSLIFIGKPLKFTCMFRQPAFGITFSLCVSAILAKTATVVIAFSATKPNSKLQKWVGSKTPAFIVIVCTSVQVLICTCWVALCPSFPHMDMASQETKIINECNEGSIIAFWIVLGYLGILATVSFIVAFFARKLPDSFNEAKFITFSMLVFCSVWLSFIPAYLSTKGKYMVAVEIFAIVASSMGLLGCIFFHKCYIIVLKAELNTREHLIGNRVVRH
ncbi:vomeronasal type-2 receptor 26-like [Protopterus annectens]|uniref:vomeronasal type-2 receptor 26-like n=1 Tax=Protopterus annectens TaxID=7888 RepID=UPI001CFA7A84|nr:vomeronasal type-2 receptor 26-like [Protopterus annectens]